MKTYSKKSGITLFVLMVTIVIVAILVTISIMGIKNNVDNTVVTSFGNELKQIEDAVDTYYITNGELPSKNNIAAVNQDTLVGRVDRKGQDKFKMELRANGDYQEDGTKGEFYELDLTKINVNNSSRGYGDKGDKQDLYMIAFPSMNIYYVKGVNAKNTTFFSLASIVENTNIKLDNNTDSSTVKLTSLQGVTIVKDNSQWMRSMGVTIMSNLLRDETLHIYIAGANVEKQFTETNVDPTIVSFNTIGELSSKLTSGLSASEQTAFENATTKYIEVIKKKNGVEVGKERIDLSNYDNKAPYLKSTNLQNYNEMNVLTCVASDESAGVVSGLKEVRYDYVTKYNASGSEINYYDGVNYDETYMKTKAKKADVQSNGAVDLKIPKEVKTIKVAVIDNAGNIQISEIDSIAGLFINYRLNSNIENSVFLDLYVTSPKGISTVNTYVSTDGSHYTDQKTTTLNTNTVTNNILVEYNNLSNTDHIFIKIVATDNNATIANRKTETKIIEINKGSTIEKAWVKDGCILRLDAKNNVGEGAHVENAKIWKDLSVAGHNSKLQNFDYNATSGWTQDCLKLDGVNDWVDTGVNTLTTCDPLNNFTLSVMVDFNKITAQGPDNFNNGDTGAVFGSVNWSGVGIIWRTAKGDTSKVECMAYIRRSHRSYTSEQSVTTNPVSLTTADKKVQLVQVYNKSEGYMALYCNGKLISKSGVLTEGYDLTEDAGYVNSLGNIKVNSLGTYAGNYRAENANINVYTASIYNRALTDQEVKQNYAYDRSHYPI